MKLKFGLYIFFLFISFHFNACSNEPNEPNEPNDPLDGLNDELKGLVLGDSLYTDFMQEVQDNKASSSIIERELFGNVLVKSEEIENQDNRFVYGVLLEKLFAGALNGEIFIYTLAGQADSLSQNRLLDSLVTNYGNPSTKIDTSFHFDDKLYVEGIRAWKNNSINLSYVWNNRGLTVLQIKDRKSTKVFEDINKRISSLLENPTLQLNNLRNIGKLDLYTTEDEMLQMGIINEEVDILSSGYELTYYAFDYEKYLEPFFKVPNVNKYMSIDGKTVDVDVDFSYITDSLETLSISISKSGWEYEKDVKHTEIRDLLIENFGEPQLTEKLRTQEEIYSRAFWFGDEIIIELENEGEYDDIVINFHIKSQPYSLNYWREPGYNNAASHFYDL